MTQLWTSAYYYPHYIAQAQGYGNRFPLPILNKAMSLYGYKPKKLKSTVFNGMEVENGWKFFCKQKHYPFLPVGLGSTFLHLPHDNV